MPTISPFAVADGSDAHRASNLKAADIQRAMLEGGTNMSFRDWELLGTKIKLAVPTTFLDLINSLGLFGNLLGTLFGDLHPLVDSFRSFHTSASTSMYREIQQLVDIRLFQAGQNTVAGIRNEFGIDHCGYIANCRLIIPRLIRVADTAGTASDANGKCLDRFSNAVYSTDRDVKFTCS